MPEFLPVRLLALRRAAVACLVAAASSCGPDAPRIVLFERASAVVEAGSAVTVTWEATGADTVDLTDTERRPLLVGGTASGRLDVTILRTTELRLIARGPRGDVEARVSVAAVPRLVADLQVRARSRTETTLRLRWDTLGAVRTELELDGAPVDAFTGTTDGAFDFTVPSPAASRVALSLSAWSGVHVARWERAVDLFGGESEPNDRRPEAGVLAGGALGRLTVGDVDLFAIDVAAGGHVVAHVGDGQGGCVPGLALRLLDPSGAALATHPGTWGCATLAPDRTNADADLREGRHFIEVSGVATAAYAVTFEAVAPRCGNGLVETRAGESCEPGLAPCRDDCTLDAIAEREPNQSYTSVQVIPLGALVAGAAEPPERPDTDIYAVDLETPGRLRVEVTGPSLEGCEFQLFSVFLERSPDRAVLASARADQLGTWCALLTGAETDVLPAGRVFIRLVANSFDVRRPPNYFLRVSRAEGAVCGDGTREPFEACDDGNTRPGDGCDRLCQPEPAAVLPPSIVPKQLEFPALGEGEAFVVRLEASAPTRLMVDASVPGPGRCDGPGHDLRLLVDGVPAADDPGGSPCPSFDTTFGTITPAGPHTLRLEPAPGQRADAGVLLVRFEPLVARCGNLVLDYQVVEECDDGNTDDGDGCSATCRLESRALPTISADTQVTIPGPLRRGQTVGATVALAEADTHVTIEPIDDALGFCPEAYAATLHAPGGALLGGPMSLTGERCRGERIHVQAAGDHLLATRNSSRIPLSGFSLRVALEPPRCGDGVRTAARGEACDDGGRAAGDGCDASCAIDADYLGEHEPNDATGEAGQLPARTEAGETARIRLVGDQRSGDPRDLFRLSNGSGAPMSLDVRVTRRATCAAGFELRLTTPEGAPVASSEPWSGACSRLAPATDAALGTLAPGDLLLEVVDHSGSPESYVLDVLLAPGVP